MSTVIEIKNLSKIYRLGEIGTGTLSRDLERWYKMKIRGQEDPFLKIGETNDRSKKGASDVVYSLRDINLEVQQGEALGIIGKNGAGKSTLLKILSRVTSPTAGRIHIKGRVASLLEVGTGFHPELTGRENIYLNGAILGMRKKEITRKLEEIIDFSGVERYIDTPVKRYSSGMYVRLAFAVAAHLESEIMIVDEVLAVGDAEFQKKCLGKMGEVSMGEGRTVLFVSHNMSAILSLCPNAILIANGEIKFNGKSDDAISKYLNKEYSSILEKSIIQEDYPRPWGKNGLTIKKVELHNSNNEITDVLLIREPIKLKVNMLATEDIFNAQIQIRISQPEGSQIIYSNIVDDQKCFFNIIKGECEFTYNSNPQLMPGNYTFHIFIFTRDAASSYDAVMNVFPFQISGKAISGNDLLYTPNVFLNFNADWQLSNNFKKST
jgi:lipopolysaccharide transport system ATP-binding protein